MKPGLVKSVAAAVVVVVVVAVAVAIANDAKRGTLQEIQQGQAEPSTLTWPCRFLSAAKSYCRGMKPRIWLPLMAP